MNTLDCKTSQAQFADLLLEPDFAAGHPEVAAHVAGCTACGQELAELRAAMSVMDEWTAPEPTPYFDTRLYARLREAQQEAPSGFLARARSWIAFSSSRGFGLRSAMAGALALVMVIGGATYSNLHHGTAAVQPAAPGSATVNDLKILDNNAQALQQMDQLLDDNGDDDAPAT